MFERAGSHKIWAQCRCVTRTRIAEPFSAVAHGAVRVLHVLVTVIQLMDRGGHVRGEHGALYLGVPFSSGVVAHDDDPVELEEAVDFEVAVDEQNSLSATTPVQVE